MSASRSLQLLGYHMWPSVPVRRDPCLGYTGTSTGLLAAPRGRRRLPGAASPRMAGRGAGGVYAGSAHAASAAPSDDPFRRLGPTSRVIALATKQRQRAACAPPPPSRDLDRPPT